MASPAAPQLGASSPHLTVAHRRDNERHLGRPWDDREARVLCPAAPQIASIPPPEATTTLRRLPRQPTDQSSRWPHLFVRLGNGFLGRVQVDACRLQCLVPDLLLDHGQWELMDVDVMHDVAVA